ncbi:MAG TPA: pyruvate kinase [Firmicutes bacterium]|nr:pyruvate kinase [Bacillota bacterium]
MRRTKILCTIGPASESPEITRKMLLAGMNVARLNFSHGSHEEQRRRIRTLRSVAAQLDYPLGILLDTRGPEIRIGTFKTGSIVLKEGEIFTLTTEEVEGDATRVTVQYAGFPSDIKEGDTVLLNDGLLKLKVLAVQERDVKCCVVNGGVLSDRKKINLPHSQVKLPPLSEKDREDIRFGVEQGIDYVAASFIRRADDVLAIKHFLEEIGAEMPVIAKIESPEGVENIDAILRMADGLMVARGDLGVEMPAEDVPLLQKMIIKKCNRVGKPVITATQMLESMVENPRPTRAEASDVANAILDGSDAVMLSAETATGAYPVEAVATMARIVQRAEEAIDYEGILHRKRKAGAQTITDAVGYATCITAHDLQAAAILTATQSGYTPRMVARHRPKAPIIAVTPKEEIIRQLTLVWGVYPIRKEPAFNADEMFERAVTAGVEKGYIREGDLVVITAGHPVGIPGTSNLIKVQTVGNVLIRGMGIGHKAATGRVCIVRRPRDARQHFRPGDIVVAVGTDKEFMPLLEEAAAIVTEEPGLTSHAAVVGLSLGIPVVVGAKGAMELLAAEEVITVDGTRGLIYRGRVQVR